MDANGQVGMLLVDHIAARADFGHAIKEQGRLVVDPLLDAPAGWRRSKSGAAAGRKETTACSRNARRVFGQRQRGDGLAVKVVGAQIGDRFVAVLGPDDLRAIGLEPLGQPFAGDQVELGLLDRRIVAES